MIKNIVLLLLLSLTLASCGNNNYDLKNNSEKTEIEEVNLGDVDDLDINEDIADTDTKAEEKNENNLNNNQDKIMNNENYQLEKPKNGDLVAVMKTTSGTMKIRLFKDDVPSVVNNFIGLASEGYYKDIIFHRVIKDFMIQGGDPTGTGMGGKSIYGEKFDDEFSPKLSNIRGSISMANSGPDTNGSQFFINQRDNVNLDFDKQPLSSKHAVFGQVYEGLDNLDKIAKVKTVEGDKPEKEIKIISIDVMEFNNGILKEYNIDVDSLVKKYNDSKKVSEEAKKTKRIETGDTVSLNYTGKLEDGSIFDTSLGGTPLEFEVGAGKMIKGFDKGVVGMKIGEKKTLTLEPKDAYGEYDEANVQELSKDQLKSFEDAGIKIEVGSDLPTQMGVFKIKEIKDDVVIIDVNHKLAGKTLIFDIEVMDIK